MKPNSNLNHLQQLLSHSIPPPLDHYNLCWSYKKRGAKTALRAPKLGYFDGRAPQLSARFDHRTPAAGVIGHMFSFFPFKLNGWVSSRI